MNEVLGPTRVDEIIPGRLFRVASPLPLDGSISFAAVDPERVEWVNCYVLTSPGRALLIDSGVRIHAHGVVDAVRGIVGDSVLEVTITRTEPDTLGNIFHVIAELGVETVTIFGNHVHPLDFSNAIDGGPEVVEKGDLMVSRRPFADRFELNGFELESIPAPMRVLATAWLYSAELKTLFTSDAFGFVKPLSLDDDPVDREPLDLQDEVAVALFHANVRAKFGWLAQTRSDQMLDAAGAVFAERDVDLVAPTHGKMLAGSPVIDSHLAGLRRLPSAYPIEGHNR
ncbi:MAG TPA: hypothetical protein VNR36_13060 [Pseudolysinimonas sp.]|nr:hypothetical protein [Pseudolysinimonas sp.]